MADAAAPLPTTPPPAGAQTIDTAYLSNNFASLAGTNTAVQAAGTGYTRSAYSYTPPGGTVAVPGLSESALNGGKGNATGWEALSDTVKYVIYAAAGVVGLLILGIVIWLCVRRSKKRKEQEARQNARLTTRSSFASPMHERETMQPHSANQYNYGNNPHSAVDEYEKPAGIFRTDTEYTNASIEKGRFGTSADAHSVHSIPPAYSNGGHGNARSQHNLHNHHQNAADMSGATLLNASTGSQSSHGNHDNVPVHSMLANVNTSLSSFKPVPPPGSTTVVTPKVEEPSYPPRMQSRGAPTTVASQDRSGTPASARRQQPTQQDYQRQYDQDISQQQHQQQEYQQQQQYQAQQQSYSRNSPSSRQQQQQQYSNNTSRQGPTSPTYSNGTSASGRSRQAQAYAQSSSRGQREDYFGNAGREPLSPTSQNATATGAGAGHRYRMPPQSRSQRAMSPPNVMPAAASTAAAYQNPYAAFADDDTASLSSNARSAGQGNYGYDQQQYQNQGYPQQDAYYAGQGRMNQQLQQQDYSASYNNYRQY